MSPKVLIVEDDTSVRGLLRLLLEEEGYEIVEAKDGLEGLLKAEFSKPDVMVVDLMMPDVDGERMIAQVKASPDLAEIPIIVVSGKWEALAGCAELLGAENVFPKPFELDRLLARLATVVTERAGGGERPVH